MGGRPLDAPKLVTLLNRIKGIKLGKKGLDFNKKTLLKPWITEVDIIRDKPRGFVIRTINFLTDFIIKYFVGKVSV